MIAVNVTRGEEQIGIFEELGAEGRDGAVIHWARLAGKRSVPGAGQARADLPCKRMEFRLLCRASG